MRHHPVDPSTTLVFAMRRRRGNRVAESRAWGAIRRSGRPGGRLFFVAENLLLFCIKPTIWLLFGIFAGNLQATEMAKVIHVHLKGKRRDHYFASIAAIYTVLTPEEVGIGYNALRHAGLSGNGTVITKHAIIKQGALIRASTKADTSTA